MCLNQIFKDEQIAIMRLARATCAREIAACQAQLSALKARFSPFPYPHRPFGTHQEAFNHG